MVTVDVDGGGGGGADVHVYEAGSAAFEANVHTRVAFDVLQFHEESAEHAITNAENPNPIARTARMGLMERKGGAPRRSNSAGFQR
jgi:hypothetical protein